MPSALYEWRREYCALTVLHCYYNTGWKGTSSTSLCLIKFVLFVKGSPLVCTQGHLVGRSFCLYCCPCFSFLTATIKNSAGTGNYRWTHAAVLHSLVPPNTVSAWI